MVVILLSRNPWHDIQKPSFIIIGHAMSSLNDIWNSKHFYIQTNVRVYQTLVLSLLLCKFETRTLINTKYDITQSIKLYRIISHKVSAKDPRNQTVQFYLKLRSHFTHGSISHLCPTVLREVGTTLRSCQLILQSTSLLVIHHTTLGNVNLDVHVPSGPISSFVTTITRCRPNVT